VADSKRKDANTSGLVNLSAFPFDPPNPVTAWDRTIASLIEPSNFYLLPPSNARMMAMVHQAIFDAVNVYSNEKWLVPNEILTTIDMIFSEPTLYISTKLSFYSIKFFRFLMSI